MEEHVKFGYEITRSENFEPNVIKPIAEHHSLQHGSLEYGLGLDLSEEQRLIRDAAHIADYWGAMHERVNSRNRHMSEAEKLQDCFNEIGYVVSGYYDCEEPLAGAIFETLSSPNLVSRYWPQFGIVD
jgi:hypothetical protein